MTKGKLIIFLLLALSLCKLNGVDNLKLNEKVDAEYKRGLGFTAGKISGVGFAYRQYYEKNGFQFTLGFISNADKVPKFSSTSNNLTETKKGWDVDGWVGFMFLRTLRESESSRFYYFLGGSMNIDYTKKYTQNYSSTGSSSKLYKEGSPVKDGRNNNSYYFGPGIGVDFKISKYISFIIELPISISSDKKIETYIPQGGVIIKF